ncbi:MAG: hypothetical protein AVDCRST_MAG27-1345, partial [uncultured Craurococcus sp.]
ALPSHPGRPAGLSPPLSGLGHRAHRDDQGRPPGERGQAHLRRPLHRPGRRPQGAAPVAGDGEQEGEAGPDPLPRRERARPRHGEARRPARGDDPGLRQSGGVRCHGMDVPLAAGAPARPRRAPPDGPDGHDGGPGPRLRHPRPDAGRGLCV